MTDSSVEAVARALAADIMAAMRRARLPKEYADEAHDEFEALTLVPMLLATLPSPEREPMREAWQPLRDLVDAARGLSHGVDWNNGTNAKLHGYRRKLLDALPGAEAALAALAPPPAQSGDRT